jgi:integrase
MPKGSPAPWFRRSRNSWFVTFGGKQHDLQTADRKEAFRRWHQLALDTAATPLAVPRLSVRELLARFLDATQKQSRPSTYDWYAYYLHSFIRTLPKDLLATDLRSFRVTQWLDKRETWGVNSRRAAIRTVKRAFQWGVEEGYLEFSPIAGLKKPPGKRRETILSPKQQATVLAAAKQPSFRDVLIVLQETGARPQEIRAVEAKHVDAEQQVWIFPPSEHKTGGKTGRARVIYLTPRAWKITKRLLSKTKTGPLFRNSRGQPWTQSAIRCCFRRLRKRLDGLVPPDLCAYVFRHTFATDALERGVDPITLAELMGHRDPTMVSRVYQHLNQKVDHLKDAACRATGARPG